MRQSKLEQLNTEKLRTREKDEKTTKHTWETFVGFFLGKTDMVTTRGKSSHQSMQKNIAGELERNSERGRDG